MSSSVADLVRSLGSADRHERAEAAIRLGQQKVAEVLPKLRELCGEDDPIVSLAGMLACWELGEDCIEMERLLSALGSGEEELVQQAVQTACVIGAPLVPRMGPFLEGEPETVMVALRALEEIGGTAALQAIKATTSKDPRVGELVQEILEDWEDES